MPITERRSKVSLLEAISSPKEIPLGWVATFFAGGIVNFTVLVWMASSLVSDVGALKDSFKEVKVNSVRIDGIVNSHASELQRALDVDNAQNARIDEHGRRIERLEDRADPHRNYK